MSHSNDNTELTKTCRTCGRALSLESFYRGAGPDGRLNHCKNCQRADHPCADCGALVSRNATLCRSCANKRRWADAHSLPDRGRRAWWMCKGCHRRVAPERFARVDNGLVGREGFSRYCNDCRGVYRARGRDIPPPNPSGLCQCGCGQTTPIADQSVRKIGIRMGEPVRFIPSHTSRRVWPELRYEVDPATGCWNWMGPLNRGGYGKATLEGRMMSAHRVMWFLLRGWLPPHLVLDHVVCQNKRCVNPDHLEPVTNAENVRRARAMEKQGVH